MVKAPIPFSRPAPGENALAYISEVLGSGSLAGDGPFTRRCHQWVEARTGCRKALLTHSCTGALEMAALLLQVRPGDEVIMPSYTFASTANAFLLRGATPVFVDIRADTLNLDESLLEDAITPRTRAVVPVHYAGVACEMDSILATAARAGIRVVEDAAQGVMAHYKGRALGSLGELGAYSFHQTKNIISGEGGCLLVNDPAYVSDAEIIREKGTDRSRFFRGEIDKYTWRDIGSSYLPGELIAALLWEQLERAEVVTHARLEAWEGYHRRLKDFEDRGILTRPTVPAQCAHNGHMYYVLVAPGMKRERILAHCREEEVGALFHYVPLHSAPAGRKHGRVSGTLPVTDSAAARIIRLPLWPGISAAEQDRVVEVLAEGFRLA